MTFFWMFLPFILISSVIIVVFVFMNPVRKRMKELGGSIQAFGDGVFDVDGKQIRLKYVRGSKGSAPQVLLSISGSFPAELVVRRETGMDRFFKQIGLNREFQTMDPQFNEKFYFECDDEAFLNKFFIKEDVKLLVSEVLDVFTSIVITRNACVFQKRGGKRLEEMSKEDILSYSRKLVKISSAVPVAGQDLYAVGPSFKLWRIILYCVSITAAVSGLIVYILAETGFRVIEGQRLWSVSFPASVLLTVIVSFLAYLKIRGYARSAEVWIVFVIFFLFGAVMLGRYGMAIYNGVYDISEPRRFETTVIDRFYRTNKHSRSYFVIVRPWHEGMPVWELRVSQEEYANIQIGQTRYEIFTKEGRLGFEWVLRQQCIAGKNIGSGVLSWPGRDYSHWFPLPDQIINMPQEEYAYWQGWCMVMEEGVTNRLNVQKGLDADDQVDNYTAIYAEYRRRQEGMLERLTALVLPERLIGFQEGVISAGRDQLRFYEFYVQSRLSDRTRKLNNFLSHPDLKAGDAKLWEAYHYFQLLYPGINKAGNDAIERRLAEFDII